MRTCQTPFSKWICSSNQGNTLHNLGVLHIVQFTRLRTRSCYFWLLCLRGMSKHAKGPFQVVKQSLNLEKRKPPLQQRRAKATCSEDKSSLSVCHPSCNPHKCLFDCPNAVMSTNSILWIVGWKAICWKGRAKCCAFLRVNLPSNIPYMPRDVWKAFWSQPLLFPEHDRYLDMVHFALFQVTDWEKLAKLKLY